jgi:hypothetical protein
MGEDRVEERSATDAVVTALGELVRDWPGAPPVTAAVTGWDVAGRPDIAGRLRERLGEPVHVVCSFDAAQWERESRPPGAMLAAGVAKEAGWRRRWWRRAFQPVSTEMSSPQTRWWRRLTAAVVSAASAAVVVALPAVRDTLATLAGKGGLIGDLAGQATSSAIATAGVIAVLFWFVAVRAWNATTAIARFASSARDEAVKGTFGEIRGELDKLVRQALRKRRRDRRFVVVLENVDGCGGDFALELCEVAKKLLGLDGVVLVFLGELAAMEEAANRKFSVPPGTPNADRMGQRHVRALIPNIVAMPRPNRDDVRSRET